jgi:hypothetical protein
MHPLLKEQLEEALQWNPDGSGFSDEDEGITGSMVSY